MVGFKEVTCAETIKVVEEGQAKALTTVTNPEGYKRAGEVTVGTGFSSFETVVTPEYHTGLIAPNQSSVRCSGTVELSFTKPLKFTQVGCTEDVSLGRTDYDTKADGAEPDVQTCNDHCHTNGYTNFILVCPHTSFKSGNKGMSCSCTNNNFRDGVDCEMRGLSKAYQCDLSLVSSDYMFGVGNSVEIDGTEHSLESPVYKVVPPQRRLTASFSTNSGDLLQRHLQESGKEVDTSGSFGTEVLLSREDNVDAAFGDLAAPAADTGAVPSTVIATAAGAVVVAAASLV